MIQACITFYADKFNGIVCQTIRSSFRGNEGIRRGKIGVRTIRVFFGSDVGQSRILWKRIANEPRKARQV